MTKVFFVAGLGFGDEGKGTTVDYLVKKHEAGVVVRYNGGAQAAHNVVRDDGVHHTFSQFGSGTFHGARTFLSKYMLVDLPALVKEGEALTKKIGSSAFDLLYVDQDALLVTPYHKASNQLHELIRDNQKHGTCGMGIGEARQDYLFNPDSSPTVRDLETPDRLMEKLSEIKDRKLRTFQRYDLARDSKFKDAFNLLLIPVDEVVNKWVSLSNHRIKVTDQQFLKRLMDSTTTVFEGAQGVLLDETYGFHPHVTWTNTTFDNAMSLLSGGGIYDLQKIGVMRTYMTRHGAGPFPTKNVALASALDIRDKHNSDAGWQGEFITGSLDLVLIKYALKVLGGVTSIAVTHMDHLKDPPAFMKKICVGYTIHSQFDDLSHLYVDDNQIVFDKKENQAAQMEHQTHLTHCLSPGTCWPSYWPVEGEYSFESIVTDILKTPIKLRSYGPRISDKR